MSSGKQKLNLTSNDQEFPESYKGRRCVAIKKTGLRCNNYAADEHHGNCWKHGAGGRAYRMQYKFKSQTLQEAYEVLANNPDRLDLGEELGLARLVLQTLVEKTEKIGSENGEGIISLTRSISELARTMALVEKDIRQTINAEQLRLIANQFLLVIGRHVEDKELLARIQDDLGNITMPANENSTSS